MDIPKRLLALEIRASRIGFAVFEGPTRLLDWGTRSFENDHKKLRSSVSDRIRVLLAFYEPFALVIRGRICHSTVHKRTLSKIVSSIRVESRQHSTRFIVLKTREVRNSFVGNGKITKHDLALSVAQQFEELTWKLPRRRKFYQSEAPAMVVFEAVANGIGFFAKRASRKTTTEPQS
jgi:hypothetical protein